MGGRVYSDPTPEQVGGGSLLFLSPIRAGKYGMAWHHCGWLPPEPLILSSLPLPYLPCHSPQHARGTRQLSGRRPSSYPPPPVSRRPVPAADNPCRRSCKMGQVVRGDGGQSPFTLVVIRACVDWGHRACGPILAFLLASCGKSLLLSQP